MAYYEKDPYFDTLTFGDIFSTSTEFITKVVSIGGITNATQLADIYERLAEKYLFTHTRYSTEDTFKCVKAEDDNGFEVRSQLFPAGTSMFIAIENFVVEFGK